MNFTKKRLFYNRITPKTVDNETHEFCDDDLLWQLHTMPLGNGYFGACVYGYTDDERIQITENSFANPYACLLPGMKGRIAAGITSFANIYLHFNHNECEIENYHRELSLEDAICRVSYNFDGVHFEREYFTSYPDRVLAIKLSASNKKCISFSAEIEVPYIDDYCQYEGDGLSRSGSVKDEGDDIVAESRLSYYNVVCYGRLRLLHIGGKVQKSNTGITVCGADEAVLLFSCGTNYKLESRVFTEPVPTKKLECYPHPKAAVDEIIDKAEGIGYDSLKARHIDDYRALYSRCDISIGDSDGCDKPTDELVRDARSGIRSPYLEELLFSYGRYLLIASSRSGGLPSNLQGIWSNYRSSPWSAGYWHNINVQMNYWCSGVSNLSECFLPYCDYNQAYMTSSKQHADEYIRKNYPQKMSSPGENGWIIGTGGWPYKIEGPGGHSGPGTGAFTSLLFWDYYDFTRDEEFLRNIGYPVLRGMSLFFSKTLIFTEGRYLVEISASPEQYGKDGQYHKTTGCAFDQQMVYENYRRTLEAAKILGIEEPLLDTLREQINLLDPVLIGKSGQVKEFREEEYYGDIGEYDHRHISHLAGMYPGTHINRETPEWLSAAEYTLKERGLGSTGWAIMHRLCLSARACNGNRTDELIAHFLKGHIPENLWDQHPPFQIDGNLGYVAGVAECLMQSQSGYIELLPALPESWKSGCFRGLVARGGFIVDCEYEAGRVKFLHILSPKGTTLKLKQKGLRYAEIKLSGKKVSPCEDILTLDTEPGDELTAVFPE